MRTEIVVFDAECLVCSAWVQFLLRADKKKRFGFASIQSATGVRLVMQQGLAVDGLDTMLLMDGPNVYLHTDAIIRVLVMLGGWYRLALLGYGIPGFLRDPAYRWVARNRYRFLGRRESCYLPTDQDKARFLD